ncbi:MAG: DNA internalization-related competence protein ComEC/Rec2 [Ruminococcaceae bacterium]|nr:DNA internalization-related competence protein ComEC/Rec2 [Oscillospiraceae bacterium]
MRVLAAFCISFAAGVFAAQYLLPLRLLPYAALGCAVLGALWALALRETWRKRAALIGAGLCLACLWCLCYARLVYAPFEALFGSTETLTLELTDYPVETEYGCRAEVRIVGRSLHGKAIYYGDTELMGSPPGTRVTGRAEVRSAAVIRGKPVSTFTARGCYALLYARGEIAVTDGAAGSPRYVPQRLAQRLLGVIAGCFPEQTRPFMNAILLGDRYELSEEDGTYLSEAGLYHVTAVSGLHCAFLVSLLGILIGRRKRLLSAIAIPVLLVYALAVGLTPSVVRACIMLILTLLAPLFGRESDPPTSLSFALFLILAVNPFAAKSISLQLSFAAMTGLILLTPRFYERWSGKGRSRIARFIRGSLCATAGALVFTIPLSAVYFNTLVLLAPISNLLCLWAATLVFATGLVTVLAGLVFLPAAQVLACVPHYGALYILTTAQLLTQIPYHAVYFTNSYLKLWLAYVYAMFGACAALRQGKLRYAAASVLAVFALVLTIWLNIAPMRGGALHVVALDVGQGQCVVLSSGGATALVDCGSQSYGNAGDTAADYLQSIGVRAVDYVVLSHYHSDHCNGLPVLLSRVRVKQLILPDIEETDELRGKILALAERYGVPVSFARSAAQYPLGEATLTVYPPVAMGDMNEECLTALCTAGSFDALFTGDMDADAEYALIATYALPDIEVLMAGHHGSRYSTGGDLLAELKPETALISCGAENSYGHPHPEALRRLWQAGAEVYRTDWQGNIHITVH